MISGGYNGGVNNGQGGTLPFVELFDPTTGAFTALTGDMVWPRENGSAHLLPSGQVLHVGGQMFAATSANPTVSLYMAPDTELYDVTAQVATAHVAPVEARRYHASVQAKNGDVVVFAGDTGAAQTATVERYDGAVGTFAQVGTLATARAPAPRPSWSTAGPWWSAA